MASAGAIAPQVGAKAPCALSAPGKVLLAGGYLITDRAHKGLVIGLSARIHVLVEPAQPVPGHASNQIIVRSPQFRDAQWGYRYHIKDGITQVEVIQASDSSIASSRNKFIETALSYALAYVSSDGTTNLGSLDITVLADSDYYSRSAGWEVCTRNPHSAFQSFNVGLPEAHKTGLGSSAALVTAFTGAILRFYQSVSSQHASSDVFKRRVHNLAQIAHCAAQGKVGSGFDVAAAVYGSCVYRRFSPSILEAVGEVRATNFATKLQQVVEDLPTSLWDVEIEENAVKFPPKLRLVMCDVDCGSETPGMVKRVMAWRARAKHESHLLWQEIQGNIDEFIVELQQLFNDESRSLEPLKAIIDQNRFLIRKMSAEAEVPIEPKAQTELIDACCRVEGVIGGVVPGAGGYDAIALIVENDQKVIQRLHAGLADYRASRVNVREEQAGDVRILNVQQEDSGLQEETLGQYKGWEAVTA